MVLRVAGVWVCRQPVWHVIIVAESVCVCLYVCVCAHVLLFSAPPRVLPPPTAAGPARNSPQRPPSLLSFIIICHEREPRRTVINKDHLKYETTTLTLGNISSVEQLVPPLSLWKGVPGAASLCPPSAVSSPPPLCPLPTPARASLVFEALGALGREGDRDLPGGSCRQGKAGPQFALLAGSVEDGVSWRNSN